MHRHSLHALSLQILTQKYLDILSRHIKVSPINISSHTYGLKSALRGVQSCLPPLSIKILVVDAQARSRILRLFSFRTY